MHSTKELGRARLGIDTCSLENVKPSKYGGIFIRPVPPCTALTSALLAFCTGHCHGQCQTQIVAGGADIVPPYPPYQFGRSLIPSLPCPSSGVHAYSVFSWSEAAAGPSVVHPTFVSAALLEKHRRIPAGGTTAGVPLRPPLLRVYASSLCSSLQAVGDSSVSFAPPLWRWRSLARRQRIFTGSRTIALTQSVEYMSYGFDSKLFPLSTP